MLDERSAEFAFAARGDYGPLAGLIAHERMHQRGERSEYAAYSAQARILKELGAPPDMVARVEKARSRFGAVPVLAVLRQA